MMNRVRRGRWRPVVFGLLLVGGLGAVLWAAFRDQLIPALPVELGQVVLLELQDVESLDPVTTGEGELLFQASGWLEPDPWPVNISVLTAGFVEEVLVDEGDAVQAGQILARLDPTDARLELEKAEWEERALEAGVEARRKGVEAAHRQRDASVATARAAAARAQDAQDTWERMDNLRRRDLSEAEKSSARLSRDEHQAELTARIATSEQHEAESARLAAELRREEAALEAARMRSEIARLALERTVIRAPREGTVLQRYVEPGSKRSAMMDDPHSAVIVSLFDPERLQVRVDVPISEAGRLTVGQPTRISTALLPGQSFNGHVSRIAGRADLQRNTLQAKVAVESPSSKMRPEVLCRVEFLSLPEPPSSGSDSPRSRRRGGESLWIPEAALPDPAAAEQEVWVVDPISAETHRRSVRVGRSRQAGFRLVLEGLRANETVVIGEADSLEEGRRVRGKTEGASP